MLAEHAAGDSYRAIGRRHGWSHEHARRVVLREGTKFVDQVELQLMVAAKHEQMGRHDEAEWPGLAVPHQPGDGWQRSLSLLQWTVDQLRERGMAVLVTTRSLPN